MTTFLPCDARCQDRQPVQCEIVIDLVENVCVRIEQDRQPTGGNHPCGLADFCLHSKDEARSEEHTSELQSTNAHLVCRLLLEKKNSLICLIFFPFTPTLPLYY